MDDSFLSISSKKYNDMSDAAQDYHVQITTNKKGEDSVKSRIFIQEREIYLNILSSINSIPSCIIITLALLVLAFVLGIACYVLHTIYIDTYQLLYWSVKYSIMKNVNVLYALSGLFSALSLYVIISILGIKKFVGKIFNHLTKKLETKVDEALK